MSLKTVREIKHPLSKDIDVAGQIDAKVLDAAVFMCIAACSEALKTEIPEGFSGLERFHLKSFVEGMPSSHRSIRILISQGNDGSQVDALVIARLQLESVYTWCFLVENAANLRWYLKDTWRGQYIRFILEREERADVKRDQHHYQQTGPDYLNRMREHSFVSETEKDWLEHEQLGGSVPPSKAEIQMFPTPHKIINKIVNSQRRVMLERLYPEYQYLCSFAHGAAASSFFKTVLNTRSEARHVTEDYKRLDIEQRQVAEAAIFYSAICAVQVATELAAIFPANQELRATVIRAWNVLLPAALLARTLWELRSKTILGVIEFNEEQDHA